MRGKKVELPFLFVRELSCYCLNNKHWVEKNMNSITLMLIPLHTHTHISSCYDCCKCPAGVGLAHSHPSVLTEMGATANPLCLGPDHLKKGKPNNLAWVGCQ